MFTGQDGTTHGTIFYSNNLITVVLVLKEKLDHDFEKFAVSLVLIQKSNYKSLIFSVLLY